MNTDTEFTFLEELFIPFKEPWGWIDFFIFSFASSSEVIGEPSNIIGNVLNHKNYRHGYISPYDPDVDEGPIHGPYKLENLQVEDFQVVSWNDLLQAIKLWISHPHYSEPNDTDLQALMSFVNHHGTSNPLVYKLVKSRNDTEHEFGWILSEFEEFVIINYQQHRVIVAVWGVD